MVPWGFDRRFQGLAAAALYSELAALVSNAPHDCDVVVVWGGVLGAWLARVLSLRAASVVFLEQNTLTSRTMWHAAVLMGTTNGTTLQGDEPRGHWCSRAAATRISSP